MGDDTGSLLKPPPADKIAISTSGCVHWNKSRHQNKKHEKNEFPTHYLIPKSIKP
jgi:hypothetical protein